MMVNYKQQLKRYLADNPRLVETLIEDSDNNSVTMYEVVKHVFDEMDADYTESAFNAAMWEWFDRRHILEVNDLQDIDRDSEMWNQLIPHHEPQTLGGFMHHVLWNMRSSRENYTETVVENLVNEMCSENKIQEVIEVDVYDDGFLNREFSLPGGAGVLDAWCTDDFHVSFKVQFKKSYPTVEKLEQILQLSDDVFREFNYKKICATIETDFQSNKWVKNVSNCYFRFCSVDEVLRFLIYLNRQPLTFSAKPYSFPDCDEWDKIVLQAQQMSNNSAQEQDDDEDDDDRLCLDSDDSRDVVVEFKDSLTDQQADSVKTLLVDDHKVHAFRRRLVDTPVFQMVVDSRDQAFEVVNAITNLEREMDFPKASISFPA